MPVYEYTCGACGHAFEQLERTMRAANVITCPSCGRRQARRALSVFAARHDAARSGSGSADAPCARCGDPDGPCQAWS